MGVPSVIQQMSNFIDVNIYYKKQLNYNTSILTMAGTFLYIYIYIQIQFLRVGMQTASMQC